MKPKISTIIKTRSTCELKVEYFDTKDIVISDSDVHHVCAFAFCNKKLVLVYDANKDKWTPPGGSREIGETVKEATEREVKEEANMRVLFYQNIGYQKIYEPHRTTIQTRSFCIVEPISDFISDPDGDITEIRLIDPSEYKKYFDWGIVGDEVMKEILTNKLNNTILN